MTGERDIIDRLIEDAEEWRKTLSDIPPRVAYTAVSPDGIRTTIELLEEAVNEIVQLRIEAL